MLDLRTPVRNFNSPFSLLVSTDSPSAIEPMSAHLLKYLIELRMKCLEVVLGIAVDPGSSQNRVTRPAHWHVWVLEVEFPNWWSEGTPALWLRTTAYSKEKNYCFFASDTFLDRPGPGPLRGPIRVQHKQWDYVNSKPRDLIDLNS